jgi:hypothetical protein
MAPHSGSKFRLRRICDTDEGGLHLLASSLPGIKHAPREMDGYDSLARCWKLHLVILHGS